MSRALINKKILLISPCVWSDFKVSKHHYTEVLAKRGNQVYFLEYATYGLGFKLNLKPTEIGGVTVVSPQMGIPKFFLFHFRWVYFLALKLVIKKIKKELGPMEVVWSFDNTDRYLLNYFGDYAIKIFHPVDQGNIEVLRRNSSFATKTFSCSYQILDSLNNESAFFVNHGLTKSFSAIAKSKPYEIPEVIKVGFTGNIMLPQVDFINLLKVIKLNPKVEFHFWGPSLIADNYSDYVKENGKELLEQQNCIFHGILAPPQLAVAINQMDALILCYDLNVQNRGGNSHKILEYLSTGKVVISNLFELYKSKNILEMLPSFDNEGYSKLFDEVISNLNKYNDLQHQEKRINFALQNTYANHVDRIEKIIGDTLTNNAS